MRINGLIVTALIAVGVYYAMDKVKGSGGMRKGV